MSTRKFEKATNRKLQRRFARRMIAAVENYEVKTMPKLVLPRVQAMVVCDALKESEERDVYHLHGVRSVLEVPSFPALRPRLCVFLQMSGHEGVADCNIQIDRIELGELIYESTAKRVFFKSPTVVEPVFFRLRNCMFPAAEVYYVQVVSEGKLLGERRLDLRMEK